MIAPLTATAMFLSDDRLANVLSTLNVGNPRDGSQRKPRKPCDQGAELKRRAGPEPHLGEGHAQTLSIVRSLAGIFAACQQP